MAASTVALATLNGDRVMTRKRPTLPDPGHANDAYVFFTPMLLLAAALSLSAAVLTLRDEPAEQTAAERLKCARQERPPCPAS
jgi:hypothetical protein